jgi:hypothetical protein
VERNENLRRLTMGCCGGNAEALDINKASQNAAKEDHVDGVQENDQEVDWDESDTYYLQRSHFRAKKT